MNDKDNNQNQAALDERAQKVHSLIQTIRTAIPGLAAAPAQPAPESDDEDYRDYSRTGKVARLPASVRETVNLMLHDNAPYAAIIEKLASLGHPAINSSNLTRWKQGGYLEWLYRRHQAESLRAVATSSLQLLKQLTPEEQQSLDKMLELTFANHMLAAFSRFNPCEIHPQTAAEVLSIFGSAMSRHFRERTRYERLLLAIRKHKNSGADAKKSTANPALTRDSPQSTANPELS